MTLKPPPRQAPTLTTPTFKDEMKANGKPSEAPPPENEDIAKLLRALNEDLRADPQADDIEDEEEEPAGRSLPVGKIALALLAAGGIAVAVVALGSGSDAPETTADSSAPMVPAPAITRAPSNASSNAVPANGAAPNGGAPEAMIARPAGQAAAPHSAPPSAPPSAAPPPPVAALPANPPPVLKVPEPPSVPATAPAAAPKPRAAAPAETPPPTPPKPEAAKPEPAPTQPAQPAQKDPAKETAAGESADTGSLQAMLAPPKEAKRPPAATATPAAPATPATPPAAKAPATATPPAGRYTVQVGTFQMTANADSLAHRLQGSGFQAYTVDWTDGSNRSWRAVRVGGFADPAAAKREAEQLKSKMGLNPVVVTAR
ncbi:SPOR domain-containing protein [Azospirillum sp. HJ39]|uniref:SPOR domain-containing protein n=1 Tax=Azospirillum sp. HJ39 TaxID=3159496 RepID=UPI003555ED9B